MIVLNPQPCSSNDFEVGCYFMYCYQHTLNLEFIHSSVYYLEWSSTVSAGVTEPLPCTPSLACKNSDLNIRLHKRSAQVLDSDDKCCAVTGSSWIVVFHTKKTPWDNFKKG